MRPKLYLETTIPSYLAAWTSRDFVRAGQQVITREWWEHRRAEFDLYVSELVIREVSAGDPKAAADRLAALHGLPILRTSPESTELADDFVRGVPLPPTAAYDALHSAISAVHGIDYLLTWNCTHIANATLRHGIEAICRERGLDPPIICTPLELTQGLSDESR